MVSIAEVTNLEELKQALADLKSNNLTLPTINPVTSSSYFEDLLDSTLGMNHPDISEIFTTIVEGGMAFDVSLNIPLLKNLFVIPRFEGSLGQEYIYVIKTLKKDFGLTVDLEISPGENIDTYCIKNSKPESFLDNLEILSDQDLIKTDIAKEAGLLPPLTKEFASMLLHKTHDEKVFYLIVSILKDKYDVTPIAQEVANTAIPFARSFGIFNGTIAVSEILKTYENKEINFTPKLLENLFGGIKGQKDFDKTMKCLTKYKDIDFGQSHLGYWSDDNIIKNTLTFHKEELDKKNILEVLSFIKNSYGITFKLNNSYVLKEVAERMGENEDIGKIVSSLEAMGFEVDRALMAFAYTDKTYVGFNAASEAIGGEQDLSRTFAKEDLSVIARVIAREDDADSFKNNLAKLKSLGFNGWDIEMQEGKNFFSEMLMDTSSLQMTEMLTILGNSEGLKFDCKGQKYQGAINIMLKCPYMSAADIMSVLHLPNFTGIDWQDLTFRLVDSRFSKDSNIENFIKALDKGTDFFQEVNGQTLIAKLVEKATSIEQLNALLNSIKSEFKDINLNQKIGSLGSHIMSFIMEQGAIKDIGALTDLLFGLGIDIDWYYQDGSGKTLFAKVLENASRFGDTEVQEILMYLLDFIKIDVSKNLDDEGNNLPLFIASLPHPDNWNLVLDLLNRTDDNGELLFNVNHRNKSYDRIIDKAEVFFYKRPFEAKEIIRELRSIGSVEPEKSISVAPVEKLDISNGRLDGHMPNQINAPKILELLYLRADDLSEEGINGIISAFKIKLSGHYLKDLSNDKWDSPRTKTLEQVIDLLSVERNVHDRLLINWDFKKVLASVMKVVDESGDEVLLNNFINCLAGLHLCALGRLVNLLYIVQDQVFESGQTKYAEMEFVTFVPILQDSLNGIKEILQEKASLAIATWAYDIYSNVAPEKWASDTLKVQGIINAIFGNSKIVKTMESYHFNEGLHSQILTPLIDEIMALSASNRLGAYTTEWRFFFDHGNSMMAEIFLNEITSAPLAAMEKMLKDITLNMKACFGDFSRVEVKVIKDCYEKIKAHDEAKATKFLELVLENTTLSEGIAAFIDSILHPKEELETENQIPGNLPDQVVAHSEDGDIKLAGEGDDA